MAVMFHVTPLSKCAMCRRAWIKDRPRVQSVVAADE